MATKKIVGLLKIVTAAALITFGLKSLLLYLFVDVAKVKDILSKQYNIHIEYKKAYPDFLSLSPRVVINDLNIDVPNTLPITDLKLRSITLNIDIFGSIFKNGLRLHKLSIDDLDFSITSVQELKRLYTEFSDSQKKSTSNIAIDYIVFTNSKLVLSEYGVINYDLTYAHNYMNKVETHFTYKINNSTMPISGSMVLTNNSHANFEFDDGVNLTAMLNDNELNLQIEGEDIPIHDAKKYLGLKFLSPHLTKWLGDSLLSGNIQKLDYDVNFILDKFELKSHGGKIEFENTDLAYEKNWPDLKKAAGELEIKDSQLVVLLDEGYLHGAALYDAEATMDLEEKSNPDNLIKIKGEVKDKVGKAFKFINDSPLRNNIMLARLDNIFTKGDFKMDLELSLVLNSESKKQSEYQGSVTFSDVDSYNFGDIVSIKNISGVLKFNNDKVEDNNFKGQVFGTSIFRSFITTLGERLKKSG